jgi:5'-nucleotidase (lipoprotein e(P4) family)
MKKTLKHFVIILLVTGLFSGCTLEHNAKEGADNEYLLLATLFQQKAAEKRALSYQAFNIAKLSLDSQLKVADLTKPLAVVVDIDETVLDNSPFEAKSILNNSDYPKYWNEWCQLAAAKPLAGSVEFLNYAKSKGVVVFYITNRKIKLMEPTLKNLNEKGFPFADEDHILMRLDNSNKESRRNLVAVNHHIALLMGDNLGDFMHVFDDKNINDRFLLTDNYKNEFGVKFIVLPNPMYGSWLNDLFNNNSDLLKEEKIKILKMELESF